MEEVARQLGRSLRTLTVSHTPEVVSIDRAQLYCTVLYIHVRVAGPDRRVSRGTSCVGRRAERVHTDTVAG
jgi:hypothetical protein